jgi:hypothetical protein
METTSQRWTSSRGAASSVRPSVRVQLLRDLPLQWDQQHVDRAKPEIGEESRASRWLSVPPLTR